MKSFDPWKSVRIGMVLLTVFILSQMFFQPRSVVVLAQDIDDVMEGFDADFGFQGKQDLKQSNLQDTNEQNREDIKFEEQRRLEEQQEETTQNTSTPPPAGTPTSDVMITFGSVGAANSVSISLGATLGFTGVLPGSPAIQVVTFIAVPQGNQSLGIMCTSGTCSLNASSPVNVVCSPAFPFSTGSFPGSFSAGCVVS